ncbi:MAG: two-component regulator propeller domain-containing protein [Gammaproteobacteria bacterium]|nr:two-component regulator propeller domain-containing protein [Gammaproteobacteria bacterium]
MIVRFPKALVLAAIAAGTMFSTALVAAQPMYFDHLGLQHGLSQNSVNDIHQDSSGFLWFATENGLNRYDGYSIRNYFRNRRDPNALQADYVWTIAEDDRGDLWLATEGAGVVHWHAEPPPCVYAR